MRSPSPRRHASPAGFTLVELMVALGVSVILAVVLLRTQSSIGQERMQSSDVAERDGELRAAMDIITQDASGSAYLFGNLSQPCDAIISYNGTLTPGFFTRHPIDALSASSGTLLNFANNTTLNYPPDSTVPSDVLVVTEARDAGLFNDLLAPQLTGDPAATNDPLDSGILQLSTASLPNATVPQQNDVALVEAAITDPLGNSQNACFRVPVSNYDPTTHQVMSIAGNYMPGGGYAGFQPALDNANIGQLGNGQLLNNPKFVDLGPMNAGTPAAQKTIAYYVANVTIPPQNITVPMLMRGQYSVLDDTPYVGQGAPVQEIAAGVVSLQVRFNVGGPAYLTAAGVTAARAWGQVCSVRIALISRSLDDDPDPNYFWKATTLTPGSSTTVDPGPPFTPYQIPTSMQHRHFLLQTTELAVRNALLPKAGSLTCA